MPFEIYYTIRLWKHRNSLIIAKRKPGLIVIGVLLASFFFLFNTIYSIWSLIIDGTVYRNWFFPIFIPIAMASWYIYIARLWLLFYQIKFNIETIKMKWQTIIDPTNTTISTKWFHLNKKKFGTSKSIYIILIIYEILTIIIIIIIILMVFYQPNNNKNNITYNTLWKLLHWFFAIISMYIPLCLILFISCKIPSYYDNIGLIVEVKFTAYCFTIIVISSSIIDAILLEYTQYTLYSTFDIIYLSTIFLWRISFFIACMIQTRYPIKKFGAILERYSTNSAVKLVHKSTLEDIELKSTNDDDDDNMKNILSNEESFDLFIKHCSNEHCLECILSVIEFIQFKKKIYDYCKENNQDLDDEYNKYLILPSNCPQSIIVYPNDENIINEFSNKYYKLIAYKLYNKYIKVGSKFEINLAYQDRKKYLRLMDNYGEWILELKYSSNIKLFNLFDLCIKEMCCLLLSSFIRFKKSNQYQILRHSF